jgi:hypothetical protein
VRTPWISISMHAPHISRCPIYITGSALALALFMSRKVKHRKMESLDPRQIQTIKVTVITLCRIDDVDDMNK